MGSFLFLGPTGVGKTELARALADALYGSRDALVQLDMSECAEATGVARLVGAAPGYVGYGEGGQLTDAVRRRPGVAWWCSTRSRRPTATCRCCSCRCSRRGGSPTAAGARWTSPTRSSSSPRTSAPRRRRAPPPARWASAPRSGPRRARTGSSRPRAGRVPPELWNRLDERVSFSPLSREDVAKVARLLLAGSSRRLEAERKIRFEATRRGHRVPRRERRVRRRARRAADARRDAAARRGAARGADPRGRDRPGRPRGGGRRTGRARLRAVGPRVAAGSARGPSGRPAGEPASLRSPLHPGGRMTKKLFSFTERQALRMEDAWASYRAP